MKKLLSLLIAFAFFVATANIQAKSDCNAKDEAACGKDSGCTYVKSYTKKDGKKVNGYCRSKGNHAEHHKDTTKKDVTKKDVKKEDKKDVKKEVKKDTSKKDTTKKEVKKDDKKKTTTTKKDDKKKEK